MLCWRPILRPEDRFFSISRFLFYSAVPLTSLNETYLQKGDPLSKDKHVLFYSIVSYLSENTPPWVTVAVLIITLNSIFLLLSFCLGAERTDPEFGFPAFFWSIFLLGTLALVSNDCSLKIFFLLLILTLIY